MERFEYDEFVPREVDLNDWHNIELGVNAQGDRTGWHLHDGPNLLLVDPHRLSTQVILQRAMVSAISRGHQMIHVHGGKRSGDLERLRPWCAAFPIGLQQTVQTFRRLQSIGPVTVIIEGFESLTRQVVVAEWVEDGLPDEANKVREANQLRTQILDHITTLAARGRDQGIHIVLAVPAASVVPEGLRKHFVTRMLAVNPRTFPASSMLGEIFPRLDPNLTGDAREEAREALQARGFALIASESMPLTLIQIAMVRSSDVSRIFRAIGAVKPKQWNLAGDEGSSMDP